MLAMEQQTHRKSISPSPRFPSMVLQRKFINQAHTSWRIQLATLSSAILFLLIQARPTSCFTVSPIRLRHSPTTSREHRDQNGLKFSKEKSVRSHNMNRMRPVMTDENDRVVLRLLQLCASTNRGQSANLDQRYEIDSVIADLERESPITETATSELLNGQWNLVYASESMTRSSPFFWGFRKAFDGVAQPLPLLPGDLSEALFAITDGLPFQSVGTVVQTVSGAGADGVGTLESAVEVSIRIFDALIPPQVGYITTTSKFVAEGANSLRLTVEETAVKRSTWSQLPVVGALVDSTTFPTRNVFERVREGSSEVAMEISYLSEELRITRSEQDQVFVFCKSDSSHLSDLAFE